MTDLFRARLEQALAETYAFERELGGGGMSRTYLARDIALNRRVVVKVLAPELLQGLSVERFKREVLMAAQLQHPHMVPVLVSGDADGLPWFSMPYVDGESLRLRMDRGSVPLVEAVSILRDVARALSYAHANGVVHRDIKPDNVLLSGGSATVTDFGIAKAISASRTNAGDNGLTQAGMAIGTPAYMAPEQAAADPELDHRADLYAFGAMAYELLSGQQLFAGRTPAKVLAAHLGEPPRDIRELRPELPERIAAVVMQCLEKEPEARPENAEAIVLGLDVPTGGGTAAATAALAAASAAASAAGAPTVVRLGRALGLWAAAALVMLAATWAAMTAVGLPDWTIAAAVALALAGLPAVVGTWWIQRAARHAARTTRTGAVGGRATSAGTMATFAVRASPHVTWTRTWRTGAVAAGALALSASGFMATRAMGVGPAASLIGSGEFGERETIVVADFRPPANDSLLGTTVGEALRTDLAQSPNLTVLTRATVRDILDRMQRPRESAVYYALAREIATREGARAVVDGEIVRLGGSYVLSARLVSPVDGSELETFRETAENDAALVPAVGALSRSIRERVGESLKGIRRTAPLERVTTSSLPALRKYVEAARALNDEGDDGRALTLLEEAVEIDSTFAMAWRRIAVILVNSRTEPERMQAAMRTAMRYRDRLSDEERGFTEGLYYTRSTEPDYERAISAYEEVLRQDSTNPTALNNLSVIYSELRRFDDGARVLWSAVGSGSTSGTYFTNLLLGLATLGDTAGVDSAAALFAQRLPNNADLWEARASQLFVRGAIDSMAQLGQSVLRSPENRRQAAVPRLMSRYRAARRGRPMEAVAFQAGLDSLIDNGAVSNRARAAARADSALVTALILGDPTQASTILNRAVPADSFADLASEAQPWAFLTRAAAYAGDSTVARIAKSQTDKLLPTVPLPAWAAARSAAYVAVARGASDEAIAQLRLAIAERASPDVEEAFLMGSMHDRAGRPDSAVVWLQRALSTPRDLPEDAFLLPLARRRLGELYEAQGNLREALRYYEAFLADWSDPEPAVQPQVAAVRIRVKALRTRLAPG